MLSFCRTPLITAIFFFPSNDLLTDYRPITSTYGRTVWVGSLWPSTNCVEHSSLPSIGRLHSVFDRSSLPLFDLFFQKTVSTLLQNFLGIFWIVVKSPRDRPDQSPLIMSRPFHLPFLGVVHHVTLWHLSFPFPIRLILLPEGSLYRPCVFPNVCVSSFSLMGREVSSPWNFREWPLTDSSSK
jgi:hypothetical protein